MAVFPQETSALGIASFDQCLAESGSVCTLRSLKFIDAYGLVGTANAIRVALNDGVEVEVMPPQRMAMRDHLAMMGFDEFLARRGLPSFGSASEAADPSQVVVPLRSASDTGSEQAISQLIWEQLHDHVSPQILEAIGEGVWEMVANGLEHSGSDASVMAQVYRTSRYGRPPDHDDKVQVVIGDVGQGIRRSFAASAHYDPQSDLDAIELSLEYLVSSVTDDPGRGQGLSTTLEQVTGLGGKMVIRSGEAKVVLESGGRHASTVPDLPGTIVALSLPLYPG